MVSSRSDAWNSTPTRLGGRGAHPAPSFAPWRVYNIGNHIAVEIPEVVRPIEEATGHTAMRELAPPRPGGVPKPYADFADLEAAAGFRPIRRSPRMCAASWSGISAILPEPVGVR